MSLSTSENDARWWVLIAEICSLPITKKTIWGALQYKISVRNAFKLKFHKILFSTNRFDILYCAWLYFHWRALGKILIWSDNWHGCYGRTIFREMWAYDEFRTDIPYCVRPLVWPICVSVDRRWNILVVLEKILSATCVPRFGVAQCLCLHWKRSSIIPLKDSSSMKL